MSRDDKPAPGADYGSVLAQYRDVPVLVLGATGFIGRHVTHALLEAGASVSVAVRDAAALGDLLPGGNSYTLDLRELHAVAGLIATVRPAVVFNLAGYGIDRSERDAETARLINTGLPACLPAAMAQNGPSPWQGQRILHVGSALEYGIATGDLAEETAAEPTTLYGQTKLAGTLGLAQSAAEHGISYAVARLFTVYGPGEHAGRLLPSLIGAAHSGQPVALTSGTQLRDFTFVGDVVAGLLRLGTVWTSPVGIVNLATGKLATVRQFTETAAQVLGIPTEHLNYGALPQRSEEMDHAPVSITKLLRLTGWAPATSLQEGIRLTRAATLGNAGG